MLDKPNHTVELRVRYHECDPMGYAHHSVFPVWMEVARIEMLRADDIDYGQVERDGMFIVVAAMSLQYRRPVRYDDQLSLTVVLEKTSAAKIEHSYQFHRDGILLATAQTTLACVDREGRPMRVPEFLQLHQAD